MKYNKKGFTLIELLVVIAIIGLLSTLAVVSLNTARQKARDARRISDIKQVQTALELYYNDKAAYPSQAASALNLGEDATAANNALSSVGFGAPTAPIYMAKVPKDPSATHYAYQVNSTDTSTYNILFTLEEVNATLGTTKNCTATPSGMACNL